MKGAANENDPGVYSGRIGEERSGGMGPTKGWGLPKEQGA